MAATVALGLLSKPMVVTLPFVLLLLDPWPPRCLAPGDQGPALAVGWRRAVGACAVVALLGWSAATWVQVGVWHDSVTLFGHAVAVTERNATAHLNLGAAYLMREEHALAAEQLEAVRAVELRPELDLPRAGAARVRNRRGMALPQQGELGAACREYRAALHARPDAWVAAKNLAWILATTDDAALRDGAEALRWARVADAATGHAHFEVLRTLAAAHAAAGEFEAAARVQEEAAAAASAEHAEMLRAVAARFRAGEAIRVKAR